MPVLLEYAECGGQTRADAGQKVLLDFGERLISHRVFDFASLAVEPIEIVGDGRAAIEIVAQETFDTNGHVGHATGRIQARPEREREIARRDPRTRPTGCVDQCRDTRLASSDADTGTSLGDQAAVVVIQGHDIGDCSERDMT